MLRQSAGDLARLTECSCFVLDPTTHVGYTGTDRSLLMGHNALLLRQIARDLLHALSQT